MASADILEFPSRTPAGVSARNASAHDKPPMNPAALRLAHALHQHLDLVDLLEHLLDELQDDHPIDGFCYSPPDTAECFVAGRAGTSSLHTRLHIGEENLGQIEVQLSGELQTPLATLLEPLASPLRNALRHHRVKLLARRDSLTGLGNRMALDATLETELARAQRFGQPFSLLIADIDNFKRINDTLGHGAGDQVIRTVATQVQDCLRPYDQAFRYGGEEFVVVLSQTGLARAMQVAERIRQRILECQCAQGCCDQVTVSIGVGEIRDHENMDILFDRTDRALYRAKRSGRNRCIAATADQF